MCKTILITGATDGIGFEAAKIFAQQGHNLIAHGRNAEKLKILVSELYSINKNIEITSYIADFSDLDDVAKLSQNIKNNHPKLDIIINNAGVLKTDNISTKHNIDIRFVVNAIAPYLLTTTLIDILPHNGRVINLSSAAQRPVDIDALMGKNSKLDDMEAYSQSKLAITMWTANIAIKAQERQISVIALNPASLLATKMVKEGFGIDGKDINIGADIIVKAALSDEFANIYGSYFDNDIGSFVNPHPDALNTQKCQQITEIITSIIAKL